MTYSYAQLEGLWINAGGSKATAPIAAAIAEAESSGQPGITSGNPDGGTNVGLWQLDTKGKGAGFSVAQLQDPATNAQVAVSGSNNGRDWSAWESFVNGAYRAFLSGKTTPNTIVPGAGASTTAASGANLSDANCAWSIGWGGIPGTSIWNDIFGSGGNLGAGEVCLLTKSGLRGVAGVAFMLFGIVGFAAPGVLLIAAGVFARASGPVMRGVGSVAAILPTGAAAKAGGAAVSGAESDAAMETRLGSGPSEESDLPVRGGTVRESGAETRRRRAAAARSRARRAANPGPAASAEEAGF